MMKKQLTLFLIALTPMLHALAGAEIEVSGAALYWLPCTSGRTIAIQGTQPFEQNRVTLGTVEPDYNWGVRMGAKYTNTCSNLWIAFDAARLWAVNRSIVSDGPFVSTLIPNVPMDAASVKDTLDVDYYTIDVSGGHTWRCSPRLSTGLYVLGRYGYMRRREHGAALSAATQPSVVQSLRLRGRFKGAGFGLGARAHYALGCGLSLRSKLLVGGLYGDQSYGVTFNEKSDDVPSGSQQSREGQFACIPFFDVIAAFEYSRCICDFLVIAGQIGWEANHYFGAIPVPGDNILFVESRREGIGFTGPFMKLALRF